MINRLLDIEPVHAADHLVESAEAQLRHPLAHLFGDHAEVVHHVLGLARELLTQYRILCRYAHRACVQMADTHHDAPGDNESRRREPKLLAAEQCGDGHVTACLQLAIRLYDDAAPQVVHHEH